MISYWRKGLKKNAPNIGCTKVMRWSKLGTVNLGLAGTKVPSFKYPSSQKTFYEKI